MRWKAALSVLAVTVFLTPPTFSETWTAGAALGGQAAVVTIDHDVNAPCAVTWYSPGVFTYSNGDLGFLAQGKNLYVPPGATLKDSLYTARRSVVTGLWQTPLRSDAPTLTGLYMTGGYPQNCTYSQTAPGPEAAPKVVYLPQSISGTPGGRYYMAFVGGNGDFIRGQVYWATSTDAVSWTVWKWLPLPTGFSWHPLVGPLYGKPGYPGDPTCAPYGITQLMLTYDSDPALGPQGGFYLHLAYQHSNDASYDMLSYRFSYTNSNGFGMGGNGQIYTCDPTCRWATHSGQLVWDYDNQSPAPGDPVLHPHAGSPMKQGAGDILRVPSTGRWLHIGSFSNQIFTQSASSLALQDWSVSTAINRTALDSSVLAQNPGYLNDAFDPGLWYGTLGSRTGMCGAFSRYATKERPA